MVDDPKKARGACWNSRRKRARRTILSLDATGRVREYQLRYRVGFRVHDGKGGEFLPIERTVQLTRDITFNDSDVLAKEAEEQLLYRDMQTDMVQQIMRRLAAAQRAEARGAVAHASSMQLRAEQLEAHLTKSLAAALRRSTATSRCSRSRRPTRSAPRARKRGCAEREVFVAERGFDWSELAAGRREPVAVRRPEDHRAAHSHRQARHRGRARRSQAYCERLGQDERHAGRACRGCARHDQNSRWFAALAGAGVVVDV